MKNFIVQNIQKVAIYVKFGLDNIFIVYENVYRY